MKYEIHLCIADLIFKIESDIPLDGLNNKNITKFKTNKNKWDVLHKFQLIPHPETSLPPLTSKELKFLSSIVFYPQENIVSPVLRLPEIRSQIAELTKKTRHIVLEIRASSCSVFDFFTNQLNVNYTPAKKEQIKTSRVEPHALAKFLAPFQAVMLHSSSLLINNRVAIFLASDEGGKTTAATLGPVSQILCDDQTIVKREGGKWLAYATPWGLHVNESLEGKVGGFFLLKQSNNFNVSPLAPQDLFDFLWHEHLSQWIYLPKHIKGQYFNFLYDLSRQIPAYELQFPKNFIDWQKIEKIMANH